MLHHLPATPDTIRWGHLDPEAAPVLTIRQGDSVAIETLSGGPRNLPPADSGMEVLASHRAVMAAQKPRLGPHMLTGPIAIEGAEAGDRLIVEIEEITLAQDWGWSAIELGFGLLPELAQEYESLAIPLDRAQMSAKLPWGPRARLSPFFGILAVTPPAEMGVVSSVPPGRFGGNVDNRHFCQGAKIAFPVFAKGAGFYAGDGHALQADGEVCDTALETALNGRLRFSVQKGRAPNAPEIEIGTKIITMGFDPDLKRAAQAATLAMIDWLMADANLSRTDAYRHCSLFAHLSITQAVNGTLGVHATLERSSLLA